MVIQILVSPGTGSQPEQFSWARSWAHPVPGQRTTTSSARAEVSRKEKEGHILDLDHLVLPVFWGAYLENNWVVGSFKYFFKFHPETWGFMIQFDKHIFYVEISLLQLFRTIVKISSFTKISLKFNGWKDMNRFWKTWNSDLNAPLVFVVF